MKFINLIYFFFSARVKSNQFVERHFPQEEQDRINREYAARFEVLNNKTVAQKSSSEIRKVLRHQQKFETEA